LTSQDILNYRYLGRPLKNKNRFFLKSGEISINGTVVLFSLRIVTLLPFQEPDNQAVQNYNSAS
jgi:hypothetical protein